MQARMALVKTALAVEAASPMLTALLLAVAVALSRPALP